MENKDIPSTLLAGNLNVTLQTQENALKRVSSLHRGGSLSLQGKISMLKAFWTSDWRKSQDKVPDDLAVSSHDDIRNDLRRSISTDRINPQKSRSQTVGMQRNSTAHNFMPVNAQFDKTLIDDGPVRSAIRRGRTFYSKDSTTVGNYRVLKTLGTGAFSQVKLAVDVRDDRNVAIKFIPLDILRTDQHMRSAVENEIELMKVSSPVINYESLKHPSIVNLYEVFDTKTDKCLVQEYIDGGELFNLVAYHLNELNEQKIKDIFRQFCKYLHSNNICHRDIKLENILIDSSGRIKLTDFGFARRFNEELLTARCGSDEYVAPEIVQGLPYDGRKTDIWALGVVLFALLYGQLPFISEAHEKPTAMFHRIARGEFRFPDEKNHNENVLPASPDAKNLVRAILQPIARKRITIDEILAHPWLN